MVVIRLCMLCLAAHSQLPVAVRLGAHPAAPRFKHLLVQAPLRFPCRSVL